MRAGAGRRHPHDLRSEVAKTIQIEQTRSRGYDTEQSRMHTEGPHDIPVRLAVGAVAANPLRGDEDELEDCAPLVLLPEST